MILKYCILFFFLLIYPAPVKECIRAIYIYNGPGTSEESVNQTYTFLQQHVSSMYKLQKIGHREVIMGRWVNNADLFVMPGGADTPYCEHLNSKGNSNIKSFVRNGGKYLGICAGAYYASDLIEFSMGTSLEVSGSRELKFFPGKSVGPHLAMYDYKSNAGARAAYIHQKELPDTCVYYNGGGYFENANYFHNVKVLSAYDELFSKPAIIEIEIENGKAILSGVHFEYSPEMMDPNDPYLLPIMKTLKSYNIQREILCRDVLRRLGITLKREKDDGKG